MWVLVAVAIWAVWYFFLRKPKNNTNEKQEGTITMPTIPTIPNGGVLGNFDPADRFGYNQPEVYAFSGKRLIVPGRNVN